MKKSIIKKIFIKICKLAGYEIIDQNEFYSPTLEKKINENLSNINKSIVLPLGEVKIDRQVKSLLILFRTNSSIDIWDQNKKRLFEQPKIEYVLRCLNSLIKSIKILKKKNSKINIDLKIIDSSDSEDNINRINNLINLTSIKADIIKHQSIEHNDLIMDQSNKETFSNLSSLLKCFEIGRDSSSDLIYFVEDDYLHFETALEEMVSTFERVSSQLKKDLFICPSDYPYLYMNNEQTNLLIGSSRHWRTISKSLCTFITSKELLIKYWENFNKNCLKRHDPFEKYINEIYTKEICISPIKSLALHLTNINSSYGLSPYIDYKSLWDENSINF